MAANHQVIQKEGTDRSKSSLVSYASLIRTFVGLCDKQKESISGVRTFVGPHLNKSIDVRTFAGPHQNRDVRTFGGPHQNRDQAEINDVRTFGGPHQNKNQPTTKDVRTFGGPHQKQNPPKTRDVRTFGGPHQNKKTPNNHISNKNSLIHLCTNADVLTNKLDELANIIKEYQPDTVGVSEVLPKKFREKIYPEQFKIDGYDMIPHPNIEKNTGRGSIL